MIYPEATLSRPTIISSSMGTILVADDEDPIREAIALALTDEGYEVFTAVNGQSTLNLLMQSNDTSRQPIAVDLLVLDLMLPQVNGLDICRYLRRQGSNLPILIISAKSSEIDRVVGLEVGADDYLAKPFGMRELVARCRALLRRAYPVSLAENTLTWQEITLYPDSCRVTVRNQEVSLSPKEFRLLELFIQYPRRVWDREQLIERIWGQDYVGDTKTVDVHIRWLREKLEQDPSQPEYIKTVRGFGYRLG